VSDDDRKPLTFDEAEALLPPEGDIHTFVQVVTGAGTILVGAHWDREEIHKVIREHGAELSGPAATALAHGIVVRRPTDEGPLFIETRENERS
jgi:hypothetical protein